MQSLPSEPKTARSDALMTSSHSTQLTQDREQPLPFSFLYGEAHNSSDEEFHGEPLVTDYIDAINELARQKTSQSNPKQ